MKITYNFGILKNKIIGIEINDKLFYNRLLDTKQTKNSIFFKFEKCTLEVNSQYFLHMKVENHNGIICFKQTHNDKFMNGIFLYYMYNTQGIPYEITKELCEKKGLVVDEEGFYVLKKIQEEISKGTFFNKNAF